MRVRSIYLKCSSVPIRKSGTSSGPCLTSLGTCAEPTMPLRLGGSVRATTGGIPSGIVQRKSGSVQMCRDGYWRIDDCWDKHPCQSTIRSAPRSLSAVIQRPSAARRRHVDLACSQDFVTSFCSQWADCRSGYLWSPISSTHWHGCSVSLGSCSHILQGIRFQVPAMEPFVSTPPSRPMSASILKSGVSI